MPHRYMIRPEHPFDIRPDLHKAASTKAESTTAESVIRPKQLVRSPSGQDISTYTYYLKKKIVIKYIFISQIDQTLIQYSRLYISPCRSVFPFSGHTIARFVVLQVKISPLIHNIFLYCFIFCKVYTHTSNWAKFESILSSNKKNIANYIASFHYSAHAIARFVVLQVKISPLIHNILLYCFIFCKVYTHISSWPKVESILLNSKKDIDDHIFSGQFSGH